MEKVSLPIKTKIAAWWIRISGIIFLLFIIATYMAGYLGPIFPFISVSRKIIFFSSILLIIFSFHLLKGKKWAWKISGILLSFLIFFWITAGILADFAVYQLPTYRKVKDISSWVIFYFLCTPPLILLLLDRKNFWKIAT